MRAIILSAGQGSRLLPLTLALPKCLVPVNGGSILDHQIEALHDAGFAEVIVVGGYRFPQIEAHAARLPAARRPRLIFNPFWSVASSIGSVWAARDYLSAPFCLINGDTIFDGALIRDAVSRVRPGINLVVEHAPAAELDDMRVAIAGEQIVAVGKELPPELAAYKSLGIVIGPDADGGEYRAMLDRVIAADDGLLAFHHGIVDRLARERIVSPVIVSGHAWQEIDRPEDIGNWIERHAG